MTARFVAMDPHTRLGFAFRTRGEARRKLERFDTTTIDDSQGFHPDHFGDPEDMGADPDTFIEREGEIGAFLGWRPDGHTFGGSWPAPPPAFNGIERLVFHTVGVADGEAVQGEVVIVGVERPERN